MGVMSKRAVAFETPNKKRRAKRAKGRIIRSTPGYGNNLKSFMSTGVSFRPNVSGFQVAGSNALARKG